jgi:Type III restriction enzyme, res subunit
VPSLPLPPSAAGAPETPEALYDRLRVHDSDVVNLWSHQADALRAYYVDYRTHSDVAVELPTGAGKTLVGLLIAEWRRQNLGQRVAFVASNNLLAAQVARKARGYGIEVVELIGPHGGWADADVTAYRSARRIAITNYHHIFSEPSYVGDAQTLVLDDAHAGEEPVAGHWSVVADRYRNSTLYTALVEAVGGLLADDFERDLRDPSLDPRERARVQLVPPLAVTGRVALLLEALDEHTAYPESNYFAKDILRRGIGRCLVFVSWREILIRPLIPPTAGHTPFADAIHRLYMSATLGAGGELERAFGMARIARIPVPAAWQRHGAGRRLFLMPAAAGEGGDDVIRAATDAVPRTLLIAPSQAASDEAAAAVLSPDAQRLGPDAIGDGDLSTFLTSPRAVLVLPNRYDGLDLPNEHCRLIVLSRLPTASHAQERFLWDTIGARRVLSERVRTRIAQGAGRATRNRQDFAAVILRGRDLIDFLLLGEERAALRPELQAELELAVHYTSDEHLDYAEVLDAFWHQNDPADTRWSPTEDYVRQRADELERVDASGTQALADAAPIEVRAWWAAWRGQLDDALAQAQDVITRLVGEELRPYRALWSYLAASWAAMLGAEVDDDETCRRADALRADADADARGLSWAPRWTAPPAMPMAEPDARARAAAAYLEDLLVGSRRPERTFASVFDLLSRPAASSFEQGLELLGKLLGFESERPAKQDAAPDAGWRDDERLWILWEAKTEELAHNPVNANDDVRHANSHATWMQTTFGWSPLPAQLVTVIATPKTTIHPAAAAVAEEHVALVAPETVGELAERAIGAHRAVRARYPALTGEELAAALGGELAARGLDTATLVVALAARPVRSG